MYLYNKKDENKIEVYSFEEDIQKVVNYRKSQMELIPEDKRALLAYTCEEKILEEYCEQVPYYSLFIDRIRPAFHQLYFYDDYYDEKIKDEKQSDIFKNYYFSKTPRVLKEVEDSKDENIKYLLLTNKYYNSKSLDVFSIMDGIINIPENLYLFEKLYNDYCNCYFDDRNLNEKIINSFLECFNLTGPITTIDISEILRAHKYNLIRNGEYEIENSINGTNKILTMKLKSNNK